MKKIQTICITLLLLSMVSAQLSSIPYGVFAGYAQQFSFLQSDSSYRYWGMQNVYSAQDTFVIGAHVAASWQNGATSHYQNHEDDLHYRINPFLLYRMSDNWAIDVRVNLENIRDAYVYPERPFYGDEFREHRAYFDVARIEYKSKYFSAKLGRDYHQPGLQFYENLLFSARQYSYDQVKFALHTKYIEISSYYLDLLPMSYDGKKHQRHLNGHRISVNLPWGYLAFSDVMIYGGEHQDMDWMAFNPLMFLYPYMKNKRHLESNTIMSAELFLKYNTWFVFSEWVLDDYQADKKVPGDLEPPEWGMNITVGKYDLFENIDWKLNYTRAANRTFNAPVHDYEKYIDKNYPVGHWLGNNFWEVKTSFTYQGGNLLADLTLYHYEFGEEALNGEFNTDFMDYTVEEGYSENFPFGSVQVQNGVQLSAFYTLPYNLLAQIRTAYWLSNARLKKDFALNLGLSWQIEYRGNH